MLLANRQLDDRLRRATDHSDVVQQTLLRTYGALGHLRGTAATGQSRLRELMRAPE